MLCWLLLTIFAVAAHAEIKFARYYGDHMVLQRGPQRAVVWGTANNINEQVTVEVRSGQKRLTVFAIVRKDSDVGQGVWKVKIPEIRDTLSYNITVSSKEGKASIQDVLFGDVWFCSGQSNMEFPMKSVFNSSEEIAKAATFKNIRIFSAGRVFSNKPLYDLPSVSIPWSLPTISSIPYFSAVCWLYGEYLYSTLNYPIGLVESDWGGTPIEAWSSPEALKKCKRPESEATGINNNNKTIKWSGHSGPEIQSPYNGPTDDSVLWNAMVNPFLDMTIYGTIWYQGEANAGRAAIYACQFPSMIEDWRSQFNKRSQAETRRDFPFGFVQLAPNAKSTDLIGGFPGVRWSQTADFGQVPNAKMFRTFMAVAMDLPDYTSPMGSIHPRDKQDVSQRLTLAARAVAYEDKTVEYLGPYPSQYRLNESTKTILVTYNDGKVPIQIRSSIGFEVCCTEDIIRCKNDTNTDWKHGQIATSTSSSVSISYSICSGTRASSVRYAWRESPCVFKLCPIYGAKTGLPGPPFIKFGIL